MNQETTLYLFFQKIFSKGKEAINKIGGFIIAVIIIMVCYFLYTSNYQIVIRKFQNILLFKNNKRRNNTKKTNKSNINNDKFKNSTPNKSISSDDQNLKNDKLLSINSKQETNKLNKRKTKNQLKINLNETKRTLLTKDISHNYDIIDFNENNDQKEEFEEDSLAEEIFDQRFNNRQLLFTIQNDGIDFQQDEKDSSSFFPLVCYLPSICVHSSIDTIKQDQLFIKLQINQKQELIPFINRKLMTPYNQLVIYNKNQGIIMKTMLVPHNNIVDIPLVSSLLNEENLPIDSIDDDKKNKPSYFILDNYESNTKYYDLKEKCIKYSPKIYALFIEINHLNKYDRNTKYENDERLIITTGDIIDFKNYEIEIQEYKSKINLKDEQQISNKFEKLLILLENYMLKTDQKFLRLIDDIDMVGIKKTNMRLYKQQLDIVDYKNILHRLADVKTKNVLSQHRIQIVQKKIKRLENKHIDNNYFEFSLDIMAYGKEYFNNDNLKSLDKDKMSNVSEDIIQLCVETNEYYKQQFTKNLIKNNDLIIDKCLKSSSTEKAKRHYRGYKRFANGNNFLIKDKAILNKKYKQVIKNLTSNLKKYFNGVIDKNTLRVILSDYFYYRKLNILFTQI